MLKETGERRWEPLVLIVHGDLRHLCGDENQAKRYYQLGLEVARGCGAMSFQLIGAIHLTRLLREQGELGNAAKILAPIYEWFTEGFATPDLRQAKALLGELT